MIMPVIGPGVVEGPGPPLIFSARPVLLILPAILILAPQYTRGEKLTKTENVIFWAEEMF